MSEPASAIPSPALSKPAGEFYIPSLDGIRAISFLLVFFHHGMLAHLVPGGFGVTTFFFLSGYLITTLLRMEGEKHGRIDLKKFYLRRVLRIFPPLYLSIAFAFLLVYFGFIQLTFRGEVQGEVYGPAVLAELCHVTNFYEFCGTHRLIPGTGVLWSLAVEEHFYLFFPLCYIVLRRLVPSPARQAAILGGVCLAVLAWRMFLVYHWHVSMFRSSHATEARIDSILFGCILAIWGNPVLDVKQISDRLLILLSSLALPLLLLTIAVRDPDFRETFRYTLQSLLLVPLFILVIRFHKNWPFRALNWGWLRFLGVLSYSLYLFHYTCIELVTQHFPEVTTVRMSMYRDCIALALSIGVAMIVHYLVERPCAALRRRLGRVGGGTTPTR